MRPGDAGRGAGGAAAPRGLRHRRHPGRHRARGPGRPPARLPAYVEFGLFPALQPHAPGHPRGDGRGERRPAVAAMRVPTAASIAPALVAKLAGRGHEPAAVQSDRRLCQLHRAGGFHADPAADPADGRGDAGRRRLRAGRAAARGGAAAPPAAVLGPGPRASVAGAAGRRAVPRRAAAPLRLLRDGARSSICWRIAMPFILSVSFLGQFVGDLVRAARDGRAAVHRHQPAAVLPGRRRLAGRGDPARCCACASFIFPSTSAIDGLVRINQMDARLADVFNDWTQAVGPDGALRRAGRRWRPGPSSRREALRERPA